jgi:hypothetical protein
VVEEVSEILIVMARFNRAIHLGRGFKVDGPIKSGHDD